MEIKEFIKLQQDIKEDDVRKTTLVLTKKYLKQLRQYALDYETNMSIITMWALEEFLRKHKPLVATAQ